MGRAFHAADKLPRARRRRRGIARLAMALCCLLAPATGSAESDAYKQHMDNGVKLFQDRNYDAAIVEFEAAYAARPRASPLVNVALARKAMFDYPRAIAALERALSVHEDTMEPEDQKAAAEAIREMRALLAYLTVEVDPPEATLVIDGQEQPPGSAGAPLALGPGTHRVGARAEGHAPAEETVTVASGQTGKTVSLRLVPNQGRVIIETGDPKLAIAVDGKPAAYGSFTGLLDPGAHVVQLYKPGAPTYATQIVVVAGKTVELRRGPGGMLGGALLAPLSPVAPISPPPPPPAPPVKKAEPARRGFYFLTTGSLLAPTRHPEGFPEATPTTGADGGLRLGYRVSTFASFDAGFDYGSVTVEANRDEDTTYTVSTARAGLNLRLMTPGRVARFVGTIGGGLLHDDVSFELGPGLAADCAADPGASVCDYEPLLACAEGCTGWGGHLHAEAGLELELGGALVGAVVEAYAQSTKQIDNEPFGRDSIVFVGGGLRVGYGFW